MTLDVLRNFIQSSHINFLYGSGVSRPYLATLGNIEKWLTKLIEDDSNEPYKEVMKASLFKVYCDGVILKNYQFSLNDSSYVETKEAYRNFLLVCNELMNKRSSQLLNKQVNLFTTNIDLLVEDAMSNSGIEINDGFRGTITPVYNESNFQISISKSSLHFHKQSEVPMFNLIKVHGAVNWVAKRNYMGGEENIIESDTFQMYYIKDTLSKIDEKYFIELSKKDAIGKTIDKTFDEVKKEAETVAKDLKDNVYKDFFDNYEKIVMINPTKEKFKTTVIDYHFYELMRIYSNALERENSILFVMGFSFADEHIAQITRRAADTNPTLQIIIFAYSDNNEDSYKKNLQIENGCSNNNILILTPSKFKASNENDNEDLCSKITNFDLKQSIWCLKAYQTKYIQDMSQNNDVTVYNSIFRIGTIYSVDGRLVKVLVDRDKNNSHLVYQGNLIKNVAVGSYVKILKGFESIIGKVESEYVESNKVYNEQYNSQEETINRFLIIKLIGHIEADNYRKGLTELPLIANECHLLTNKEFEMIHSFGSRNDVYIKIGSIASDSLVPISIGINKLFASHIGIFGNTGSGKSYTLAKIYRQLFDKFKINKNFNKNAKFLFYDFNGEYSHEKAIIENKKVYDLSTSIPEGKDKIPLSDTDMLDENLLCIFANATEKTQRPFIVRCIKLYKSINGDEDKFRNYLRQQISDILMMSDKVRGDLLIDYVEQILPSMTKNGVDVGLRKDFSFHSNGQCYYTKVDNRFINFQERPQYINTLQIYKQIDEFKFSGNFIKNFICIMYMRLIYDVLGNRAMNEHIAPAINKLKSNEKSIEKVFNFSTQIQSFWNDSNIVVINLCDVNTDMKKLIPLLLTNKLYNEYKKRRDNKSYLNIVVDEAHNILSYQSTRESESWKDYRLEVFEEIIKEGRKFGVFMTIASQRPSDISSTIISQLHNYFIHRLMNEKDIQQINNTISYLDKVSVESLPILSTGVCVLAGQLAEMPIVVQIDKIEDEYKPQNETIDLVKAWNN